MQMSVVAKHNGPQSLDGRSSKLYEFVIEPEVTRWRGFRLVSDELRLAFYNFLLMCTFVRPTSKLLTEHDTYTLT